ncbi:DUF6479 family protein [Streptomyces sp. NPDC050504]|uniref:DUF6479 family protein n=1 Tax=Streptomyces sp. NPDC050504 TaxID=3365618 RepID=UPI0037A7B2C7
MYRTGTPTDAPPLALDGSFLAGAAPFAVGLVLVAVLVAAVWWGMRRQDRQPGPPTPDEQPRLPESGPVGEVRERRAPAEVPRGRGRLTPHQLMNHGNQGTRRADGQAPRDPDGGGPTERP